MQRKRRDADDPSLRAATLEDVARAAGVSTATVSRCLNAPKVVAEDTLIRVLGAVQKLNYAPHFGAQVLATKKTNTFGAVIPTMENAIFARGLQAFQEEIGQAGITLLVASSSYSLELEETQIRALVARGADALLLIGHDRTAQSYEFLERRQIPYVVAWSFDQHISRSSVGFDNAGAMRQLAQEVLRLGHRRLGYITAPVAENDRARGRLTGVRQAISCGGLDANAVTIVEVSYSIQNGAEAFGNMMISDERPTAVLCANDVLAAGAIARARNMGLRVPDDVSITGFDDIEISQIVTPRLTTVHVPHREMGQRAAQFLLKSQRSGRPHPSVELTPRIILRDSLGPPPHHHL